MSRRGPIPKQTVDQALRANGKPTKRRAKAGVKHLPADAQPPDDLCETGKMKWVELAEHLSVQGLLSPADRDSFRRFCQAFADERAARETLAKEGQTITCKTGFVVVHPCWKIVKESTAVQNRLAIEFGLTPAARCRVHVEEPDTTPTDIKRIFGEL